MMNESEVDGGRSLSKEDFGLVITCSEIEIITLIEVESDSL